MLRIRPILLLVLAVAIPAAATPKRPDLKKLLSQPQAKHQEYVPARAGWDGPEQNPKSIAYFQQLAAPTSPQLARATLLGLLIPDWRIALGLFAMIFVLRYARRTTPDLPRASHQQPPEEIPRAA